MQGSVSLGSSLNLALSPRCSYTSSSPGSQRSGAGLRARNGASAGPLTGCRTVQGPFQLGSAPLNPFRCPRRTGLRPSLPSQRPYDRQTKAFARFFHNGTKWGHKEPLKPENPPNHGNGAFVSRSWVQRNGANLLQKSVWVVAIALIGGGALLLQARAQNYIERNLLPSATRTVGQYFGREVQLGKVRKLTPLGVTLGPCSVGAHEEEFTCAEIPGIELRVLPLASLRKGQLVVDAVITEPHILVSQKEDWTWLGIPIFTEEKLVLRHSSEPNIDSRTKVRRLAKEETERKFATDRKQAARDAANHGYKLPGANVENSKHNDKTLKSRDAEKQQQQHGNLELEGSENEEEIDTTASYLGVDEGDGIKAGQHVEERLTECDESNPGFELRNSVLGAKVWIGTNIFRPAKRRILRKWTKQGVHPLSKLSLQRKNLDRSAAAARAYFERLDKSPTPGKGASKPSDALIPRDESLSLVPVSASDRSLVPPASEDMIKSDNLPGPLRSGKFKGMGSGDVSGVSLHPFVPTGRSTRPPMSISSSWGARAERTEDGNHGRLFPNLAMKIEDAVGKKRGIEQVNFRKVNSMRANLKSLGMKAIRRERQGPSDVNSDDRRAETVNLEAPHTMTSHTLSKPTSNSDENGLSRVESVKAALVQAIRERQEGFSSMGRSSSSSAQNSSTANTAPPKHNILDSESSNRDSVVAKNGQVVDRSEESSDPSHTGGKRTANEMIDENLSKTFLEDGVQMPYAGTVDREELRKDKRFRNDSRNGLHGGIAPLQNSFEETMETRLMDRAKSMRESTETRAPVALNSVYFKDGTLMLLAFGDREPRVMEKATGQVKFGNSYEQINVKVTGSPKEFRVGNGQGDGGKIFVKVAIDVSKQEWHLKVRGRNLFAPLFEKLFELPLDWSAGRATGEVHAWMMKDDPFPSFGGRVDVKGLDFGIWDAPAPFKGVSGTLFFQEQRLFFHNASGLYGEVPLQVSGDMDLNPDDGEYRLSCQVAGVEANALMKTLKVQPPPFTVAGALKGVVHCRGPLDAPIFEGSAEVTGKQMALVYDAPNAPATRAVKESERDGAIAAYDRVPFASASASFTFNTDDCMAELYGLRAVPVGGGEIRGSGSLWICPEGELDPSSVNVDCSGTVVTGPVLRSYSPSGMDLSSLNFGTMHGKAKIRGALLMPVFDIKWDTPEAQGSFVGAHGDVHICREAISVNSSASAYDLSTKIHTLYPPISEERKPFEFKPGPAPTVEGLDLNLDMRGFDIMGLVPVRSSPRIDISHLKLSGTVALNGEVPKRKTSTDALGTETTSEREEEKDLRSDATATRKIISELVGKISLSGLKLNQLLVAPELRGSFEVSPSSFKIHSTGGADEHLHVFVSDDLASHDEDRVPDPFFEEFGIGTSFSLHRGPLRADFHHQPGQLAKLEVRNLQLDELEVASLRGDVQKAELGLNFLRRRGQGCLSVRQPRCSGIQGESLDIAARWSGDVITVDKSVLELAKSRYEMQGEYVLPSLRDRSGMDKEKEGMLVKAMAGQLGNMITSLGRWRVRLDVPAGEMSDMLPIARLLSRSSDPAVLSRSKELFLQGVKSAGFATENLKQLLEYIRNSKDMATSEGSTETYPLPGLAELKGSWKGSLDASGGGDGDTYADFDFRGDDWEWGPYKTRRVITVGDYCNNDGLRFQKLFIQKDRATLHADGTLLGPKPNLHFAVLNLPVDLVPPLLHAVQASTPEDFLSSASRRYNTPIKGILYMEGDLRGHLAKPQCDLQIRLLDGSIGGISLGKAEMAASLTSASRLAFNAVLEPSTHSGHVRIQGSLPTDTAGMDGQAVEEQDTETEHHKRAGSWGRERGRDRKDDDASDETLETGGEEGWEKRLAESLKALDGDSLESGAVQVDAAVKDGGMMLLTAISPGFQWTQGNADIKLQVRGTLQQPSADGTASFHKVTISSPVLPRPLSNLGGSIRIENNQVRVEELVGRVGRRGFVEVKGKLPLRSSDIVDKSDAIDVRAEALEVRAKHAFSGQVNSRVRVMGSLIEPELTGVIKLSNGDVYLSQEKGASPLPTLIPSGPPGGGHSWMVAASSAGRPDADIVPVPKHAILKPRGSTEEKKEEKAREGLLPFAVRLRSLKFLLGPELRMVYPLILNFAVSGELELNGFADIPRVKPRGMLTFENGDINLVATQLRLSKDHPNRAKFEPEQGLDPTLDLALIGTDWQLKVQGRARNWQDNIVISSTRSGEDDVLTRTEAARVFESQLAESLLEQDGQLAFKKLAAATVETLMPKIETKGEFGQARWRLVSAPQISNLLSLDPTIDPFKSLANLSFGAEVEVQLGRHLQASVARRLKESEMATEWTLLYQLNSKLRLLFSSIPSVDNRLLFEYSATSQN